MSDPGSGIEGFPPRGGEARGEIGLESEGNRNVGGADAGFHRTLRVEEIFPVPVPTGRVIQFRPWAILVLTAITVAAFVACSLMSQEDRDMWFLVAYLSVPFVLGILFAFFGIRK